MAGSELFAFPLRCEQTQKRQGWFLSLCWVPDFPCDTRPLQHPHSSLAAGPALPTSTKKSPLQCEPGQHVLWKNDITPARNLQFLLWGSRVRERRSKGSTGKRSPQREKHPQPVRQGTITALCGLWEFPFTGGMETDILWPLAPAG